MGGQVVTATRGAGATRGVGAARRVGAARGAGAARRAGVPLLAAITLMTCAGPASAAGPAHLAPAAPQGQSACAEATPEVITAQPWSQEQLGLRALAQQYRGWKVTIAVISSGVDAWHPQLRSRVLDGITVGDSGAATSDCLGFGTAIAGAASAAAVSGTTLVGVAQESSILPVRIPDWMVNPAQGLTDDQRVQASTLLAEAITQTLRHDPDIIVLPSASLPDTLELRAVIAAAEEQGCLLVEGAPAKADGVDNYPVAYPEVFVVDGLSADGAFIQTQVPANRINIVAPGMEVPVLAPGKGHRLVSSSEVAAGFVAGAAALVIEGLHPATPAALRQQLVRSKAPSLNGNVALLDPAAALTPAAPASTDQPKGALGRVLGRKTPPERASIAATAIAATAVIMLLLVMLAAAAVLRGRRRGWRPAGRPAAPATESEERQSLTDDPYRPPGSHGAWWLAGKADEAEPHWPRRPPQDGGEFPAPRGVRTEP